jgi:hypothetical protein
MRGQRLLQIVILGIAVFPGLGGCPFHGRDGLRRWSKYAFIGADAGAEGAAAVAILRLRPDERHGRGQLVDDRGEAVGGHGITRQPGVFY